MLPLMNDFGRVSICGCISQYNVVEQDKGQAIDVIVCTYVDTVCMYTVSYIRT